MRPLAVAALAAATLAAPARELSACSEPTGYVPPRVRIADADPATRVRGRVVSAADGALPGARAVLDAGPLAFTADLGAGGAFDVAVPASTAAVRVLAVAPGCVPTASPWVGVAPGRGADAGTLRLEPCAALRGRVTDAEGLPVPFASVEFACAATDPAWELAVRTFGVGTVDADPADGSFAIDVRPAGDLVLRARSGTHGFHLFGVPSAAREVVLAGAPHPDGPRLDVALRFDPPDLRAPDDRVVAEAAGTGVVEGVPCWGEFSAERTRFAVGLPTTLRLVGTDAFEPFALRLDRMPRGTVTIPLRPRRNTAVGGDVVLRGVATVGGAPATWSDGSDGRPAHGHRLVVVARRRPERDEPDGAPRLAADTTTRPDGTFEIAGLIRGRYTVRVAAVDASFEDPSRAPLPGPSEGASADGTYRVEAPRREERVVVLDLAPGLRAAPDLRFECVAATWRERFACEATTETENPLVRVRGVPPGTTFDLSVRVRANGRWTRRTLASLSPDRLAAVAVPDGARLRCRVLAGPGGPPAPGVEVEIHRFRGEPGDVVATDAEGRIDLSGFEAGAAWTVTAQADGAAGWVEALAGSEEATLVLASLGPR